MNKLLVVGIIVFSVVLKTSIYIVTEGQQVIITQFGRPVKEPISKAGFYFKLPFLQEVRYVDKRILSWDGFPNQIPTKDKKYIKVDTTARWKVVDVLKFIQTVQNERGAKARLDTIIDSTTRDVISNQNLVEAVRNSNLILDKTKEKEKKYAKNKNVLEEEITGEIEEIFLGREQLSSKIVILATKELSKFGIELIDVQLRRISYEKSVEQKVYERMISERQRIAQKIRSIGLGEKRKIEGRIARDLEKIQSEAYKKAQIVKGRAEAISTEIFGRAIRRGPRFFDFMRTMEAYENSLKDKSRWILSSDSQFLKYFK